jgi:putative endonuclease
MAAKEIPRRATDPPSARTPPRGGVGDPRRRLGCLGEELAAAHFSRVGFSVLDRNVRTRHGEIDLIAFAAGTLVFAEVKTLRAARASRRAGEEVQPLAWLRAPQRARVRRLALAWLGDGTHARPSAHTIRFDAVGVVVDERGRLLRLDHVEAAW